MNKRYLLKEGFVSFNLKDFDERIYNELLNTIPTDSNLLYNNIDSFLFCGHLNTTVRDFFKQMESDYKDLLGLDYEYKNQRNRAIDKTKDAGFDPDFLSAFIPSSSIDKIKSIKDVIFNKFMIAQNQSWFQGHLEYEQEIAIRNIQKKILKYFYNGRFDDVDLYFPPKQECQISLTSFSKGSLITDHADGANPRRLAAILIYLNKDWDIKNGGNLIVRKNEKETLVPAEYGQVVILDFTENNVHHEVTPVMGDRDRWAVLSFIERP